MMQTVSLQCWRTMNGWHFVLHSTRMGKDGQLEPLGGMAWTRDDVPDETLSDWLEYVAEELFDWAPLTRKNPLD